MKTAEDIGDSLRRSSGTSRRPSNAMDAPRSKGWGVATGLDSDKGAALYEAELQQDDVSERSSQQDRLCEVPPREASPGGKADHKPTPSSAGAAAAAEATGAASVTFVDEAEARIASAVEGPTPNNRRLASKAVTA